MAQETVNVTLIRHHSRGKCKPVGAAAAPTAVILVFACFMTGTAAAFFGYQRCYPGK